MAPLLVGIHLPECRNAWGFGDPEAERPTMTVQKHLKERVRSRMQKTGEAYTTARRHVLNQRDDAVPRRPVDPALRWHFPGNIPTTTALRILLTHAGVRNPANGEPLSEALLFVIA